MRKILGLCSYPSDAAATRFRLVQFVEALKSRGIELTISPFLDTNQFKHLYSSDGAAAKAAGMLAPTLRRLKDVRSARSYDVLFVQREAMLFGPGVFEWLYSAFGGPPMVLDLDDATYVRYVSPTYGRIGSALKFFGKTDGLIKRSSVVTCGNRYIAEYVESTGTKAVVVPTVVDLEKFRPIGSTPERRIPTIGWIGTHSTYPLLTSIFPVLEKLAKDHEFRLKVVGSGQKDIKIEGVRVENLEWELEREVSDFQSIDIGLYPITQTKSADMNWLVGKSGFKAIQYMAVGVAFVMTPIGVCAEMGEPGRTHFNARNNEEWHHSLEQLLMSPKLRRSMGSCGREFAVLNYALEDQAEKLANVFNGLFRPKEL